MPFKELKHKNWQKITAGRRWGGNWESAWFKFTGTIPKEWKGKEIFFLIDTGSEACVFSEKGEPLAGLTSQETRPDQLFRKSLFPVKNTPGAKVSLLVEAAANMITGYSKDCFLKEASLVILNREKWNLWHDIYFLVNLHDHLPENHPKRKQLMYAVNNALNCYGAGSQKEVTAARAVLKPKINNRVNYSSHKVSAVGHAHIDVAWLWPLRETVRKVSRTFSTALKLMEEYPEYKFGASQPQLYEYAKKHYPSLYEKIKKAVKAGRWEPQGAMWVEADCNLISGESMVRQIIYGKRFFKEEFGKDVDNLWLPDVFGYSASMPQILKLSGVNYFMTQKISWSQFNKFPYSTFMWQGIDGTKIFSHFLPTNDYNGYGKPKELLFGMQNFAEKDRAGRWLYLFGIGDGGGGPSRHHLELLQRSKNCEELPQVKMEFASEYFKQAQKDIKDIPLWVGELYLEFHRGTYTSQARNKKYNRKSEYALRDLELLSCLGMKAYPQTELNEMWKTVLLNQFHDIIPGSSIAWVYKDSLKQYAEVLAKAGELIKRANKSLADKINTSGPGSPVVLFNTLSWKRNGTIEIPLNKNEKNITISSSQGNILPAQLVNDNGIRRALIKTELPPVGYSVVFVSASQKAPYLSSLKVTEKTLENDLIKVELNKDGFISRIYDKEARKEVIPTGKTANVLSLYKDTPTEYDAWEIDISYEEQVPKLARLLNAYIKEAGPIRISIVQEFEISSSKIIQEIKLTEGSKLIEFSTRVNWKEVHKMLRTAFPVNVMSDFATYEIQYGNVRRNTHRNTSWDMAKFEVVAHKWADLSEPGYGAALLNDSKYGHKILGNVIDLNLLRSPKNPDPTADMCEHTFSYALFPHKGNVHESHVIKEGYCFNVPVQIIETGIHKGTLPQQQSFISIAKENVILEVMKKAEDDNSIILRFYEASGSATETEITFGMEVKNAVVTDLLENQLQKLTLTGNKLKLSFHPFEIKTIKLPGVRI
ncbi:MAG: hypothetical protein A2252_09440 [Elusimicrobia bacterium RIFOXYA2_FULL_39_19]|nr:MAG: hypothetical protein A2252_09440 [Elusimicrobia bacterium RIFOXYA2_FULL_39_19]